MTLKDNQVDSSGSRPPTSIKLFGSAWRVGLVRVLLRSLGLDYHEVTKSILRTKKNNDTDKTLLVTRRFPWGVDLVLDLAKATDRGIYFDSLYEKHITHLFRRHVRPGDVCVDVGACVGYYTTMLAKIVGPSGLVVAFEPESANYKMLVENVTQNRLGNVKTYNLAVSNIDAEVELCINPFNNGGHSLERPNDFKDKTVRVQAVRLDRFFADQLPHAAPAWIKIDVEGHQKAVLEGMRRILKRHRPHLVIEHPLSEVNKLEEFFADYKYVLDGLGSQDFHCYPS